MIQVPSAVRARLKGVADAGQPPHVDPNLLAAFAEQSLLENERASVMTHLAQCWTCREVVSLALPEQQPEMQTVGAVASPVPWWNRAAIRWSAVAATATVVVAAVMMRPPAPQLQVAHVASPAQIQQNPAPSLKQEVPAAASGRLAEARPSAPASILAKQRRESKDKNSINQGVMLADSKAAPSQDLDLRSVYRQDATTSRPSEQEQKTLAAAVNADAISSESAKKLQAPEIAASGEMGSNEVQSRIEQMKPNLAAAADVMRGAAWSISQGRLLRSLDGRANWEPVPVDSRAVLKVFWAFDSDVWTGGDAGALYHSSNRGETWTRVRPVVNDVSLKADIINLEFEDAQHGTVFTAAGEKWLTSDGGLSWKLR
ncbi:MAG TPA: hypothetical protein VK473_00460 [Terriglobales bacterium]|nr:hypothetical protein [Terriglobales bacterium]